MSDPYEEIVAGERLLRRPPGERHEAICGRLHQRVGASLAKVNGTRLLSPRSVVQLNAATWIRPDLALVAQDTGTLWLAAEIIYSEDHAHDTVTKKMIYEEINLSRLWMIDPRYNNVEVYHGTPFGLALKSILYGREVVTDERLPDLQMVVAELFGA